MSWFLPLFKIIANILKRKMYLINNPFVISLNVLIVGNYFKDFSFDVKFFGLEQRGKLIQTLNFFYNNKFKDVFKV